MSARIIDGKAIAQEVTAEVERRVKALIGSKGVAPGLAVILVGADPASQVYVRMKRKRCEELDFYSQDFDLDAGVSQDEVARVIADLNADPRVHGILLQMPVPDQLDGQALQQMIDPRKDVDGFHPVNVGRLALGMSGFVPCTPLGVRELLLRSGVDPSGKFVVIVGRSHIVGRPLANLLMRKEQGGNATVCVCHSRTANLAEIACRADILIAAIGSPEFITGDMVKPGATVIDVGVNRVDDSTRTRGYRLVGDVDFEAASEVADAITPVPGGVGPMTIAMLMHNTVESAEDLT